MTQETKAIICSGTFITGWGYYSADLIRWMRYPLNNSNGQGETVNYSYNPQMLMNALAGTSSYVQSTSYDAAGRVELRTLGGNVLKTDYEYYDWTQDSQGQGQGRLKQIKTGTPSLPTSLQDLSYAYDLVGNVLTISDAKTTGGTQVQTFTYDSLNRLITAQALGGSGGTYVLESYIYNASSGLMTSKAGVGYTYGSATHTP